MAQSFAKYLSLVKFAHTVFALPFALIGFTMGVQQMPQDFTTKDWIILLFKVLVCMVTARNAAMGFNRYADRDIDAENPRTAGREIPAGVLSPNSVMLFVIVNSAIFTAMAAMINPLCGILAPVALLVLLGYSKFKRFSALCHFILGLSLGIAPVGAFLAVNGSFMVDGAIYFPPIILTCIIILWSGSFDILYSVADEEFDKEHKLHSIPAAMGRRNAMALSGVLHAIILPLLVLLHLSLFNQINYIYMVGAVIFTGLLIYQHSIVSPKDISRLNAAFFTSNGLASILFAIFTIWALVG